MNERPDPELLLSRLKEEEAPEKKKGSLRIFFGAVAGVGKTYSMLQAARSQRDEKVDVVVGVVETHGRRETEELLEGLEILPPKYFEYKGTQLKEMDIDAALARKPEVLLVDELAHTNAPGSRHKKRWQDVQELLESGIDVYTTLNVQHVESLHDVVAQITRVSVRERVPDFLLEKAQEIELIDLPPDELLERMKEGKIYIAEQARAAMQNFFRKGNLIALRELVLRYVAERVVADMEAYRQVHDIKHPWPATERILVCVSPSPLASRLVRAGKRMAEALRAKWTVLFVEASHLPLAMEDKDRVIQTLRLAEQLGAETLELTSNEVPQEIIKCAKQYNVSKIIIGKSHRSRWREMAFGSVVDEVIRLSGVIDVYVITGDDGAALPAVRKRKMRTNPSAYVQAVLIIVVFTIIAKFMCPVFELSNVVMFYLLGVILVAARFGRGPSILASVLSVATFDFFCVPPYLTFAVSDTQYVITFGVMLVVALIISTLTVTIKQQAETARLREIRTAALYSMSRDLSSTMEMDSLLSTGLRHISAVFDCQTAVFLAGSKGKLNLAAKGEGDHGLRSIELGVATWVHQNKQAAGLGTNTLPGHGELYVPMLGAEKNLGVLAVKPQEEGRFLAPDQFRLLETFVNQIALACERTILAEENAQARVQVKTEQLRNSLLSSVSHDLRTPLATISGAASSILEGSQSLDIRTCKLMVSEIYDESMRLNRLVSNLLDMTKLESGSLKLKYELYPVDEIVGAAISCMEDRLGNHPIDTQIPDDLPFVQVDATLIQQVLVNLIENAVKYSPEHSRISISAERNNGDVVVSVADQGPGIKPELKEKIFEKFYREQTNNTSGAGLGLAICSGITEAHSSRIWVEDNSENGSTFKFTLPVAENHLDLQDELAEKEA